MMPSITGIRKTTIAILVMALSFYAASAEADGATPARFLAYNIWGDFFGNPPHERDLGQAAVIRGHDPDIIGLQEMTPNFWKSRLLPALSNDYEVVGRQLGLKGAVSANPVLFRRSRFEKLEEGAKWFCPELDYSKGVVWVALRDRQSGRNLVVFASHFWWRKDGVGDDWIRLYNAQLLHGELTRVAMKYDAAIVGGGDLNSPVTSSALAELVRLGWADAQKSSLTTDARATWRSFPVRGADGKYHGVVPEQAERQQWLDHVFYTPERVEARKFAIDRSDAVMGLSDHLPIVFDFTLR